MRRTFIAPLWICLVALVTSCASSSAPVSDEPASAERRAVAPTPEPSEAAPTAERRCLPVVAAECGCVYSCGVGTRDAEGWSVAHSFWGDTPVRARVDRWCVEGQCTEAFFGEIVCDGICAPRPADPSCAFDAEGSCSGSE
jgi:hypothetical protein